jgi:double zinc ribbon protein
MNCLRCQHENPQAARFCEECATPLVRICPNCRTVLSAKAKFCHACAHPVAVEADAPSRSPEIYEIKRFAPARLWQRIGFAPEPRHREGVLAQGWRRPQGRRGGVFHGGALRAAEPQIAGSSRRGAWR